MTAKSGTLSHAARVTAGAAGAVLLTGGLLFAGTTAASADVRPEAVLGVADAMPPVDERTGRFGPELEVFNGKGSTGAEEHVAATLEVPDQGVLSYDTFNPNRRYSAVSFESVFSCAEDLRYDIRADVAQAGAFGGSVFLGKCTGQQQTARVIAIDNGVNFELGEAVVSVVLTTPNDGIAPPNDFVEVKKAITLREANAIDPDPFPWNR